MVNIGIIGTGVGIRTYLNTFKKLDDVNCLAISGSTEEKYLLLMEKLLRLIKDMHVMLNVRRKYMRKNGFYIGNNRAMVSLEPLTEKRYCPYNCAFCYVKSGFMKYNKMEIKEIIKFLIDNKRKFDIVYISGDTDSFAPPRTDKAIELLKGISENIDIDILFTTRATFNDEYICKLKEINNYIKSKKHKLIASISISRLFSAEHIEPHPIPSPEKRIEMLKKLKKNGIYTILATRPFLPIIDADEYIEIINRAKDYTDVVIRGNMVCR